ncbi:hypothetical protein BDQ94DRAFT_176383 [Aspergillus welwitschiae]|uniref:Uncharacterized protein n=1 Tax=Aspergillus welwitschiae TaxID=1341132 RepID=A0A3F3PHK9_9EURO|nr:hypothetical protein BDQ94DRAFT_176383 [Aspergillus welwitschiae]RDH26431.1 hypothetical protein BDQ94DRAFT_176383 [Aspergillus welwitschiae]
MASGVEEPTVDRNFVVNNANESDPNLDHRDLSSQNLEDNDVPPIQSTIQTAPCEQAIAAPPRTLNGIDIQPCGQLDVGGRKTVLEGSGLPPEPDHFNMAMLRLLSLYPADTSRYRRFRHTVHRKGVVIVRRQLKIMSRCVSEALRASDGSINGTEFVRLVLRHHPYYGQTIIAANVLRQLLRRLAKTNRRSLLNIAETVIRH